MEGHREPHQAVSEGGYPVVEAYHVAKMRTGWTDAGTEMLTLTYDDPDTEMITAHEQRQRADKLQRCTKAHPTLTRPFPEGQASRACFGKTQVCGESPGLRVKRVPLKNKDGPLIVTHEASIPPALGIFMPTAVARVEGHIGREQGGTSATTAAGGHGSVSATAPSVRATGPTKQTAVAVVRKRRR